MGIRPVDAQTAVVRAQDAASQQHQREAAPAAAQASFAAALRQKDEEGRTQVPEPPQAAEVAVRPHSGRDTHRGKGGRPRPGAGGQGRVVGRPGAPGTLSEPGKGGRLDVRV